MRRRAGQGYDLLIASQLHMAPYALLLPDTPRVLEEVELAIIREQFGESFRHIYGQQKLKEMHSFYTEVTDLEYAWYLRSV